ncbi:D-3-phosphoglycerate dehydrogenase [Lachnospiraceae bacterium KM106-2]|nr:D-3-phosphoglycerate dehydrogenase [Lachnospiraceae bacterium KM106-2]
MKITIIQEDVQQPDITEEELSEHWRQLYSIPEVDEIKIYKPDGYPDANTLHTYIQDADVVFGLWISKNVINKEFLSKHPNLKYISCLGHGFEEFDTEMVRKMGLTITNTIYGAQTIAEHSWALLMEICHNISYHSDHTKTTDWTIPKNIASYGLARKPLIELYGKTIGIIGLGSIGFNIAKIAASFGMHVLSYNRHKKLGRQYRFVEQVSIPELLERSDVISLNCPYTAESANMINQNTIEQMKDGVILINTARGGLINEQDLADALNTKKIYAAGLDVLATEPNISSSPLLKCDNAYITQHIAWLTRASRFRAIDMAIDNFEAYLQGEPKSVIS